MRIFASILLCYLFFLSIVPTIANAPCFEEVTCCEDFCHDTDSENSNQESNECGLCNPLMQCTCYNVFFIPTYNYIPELDSEDIVPKSTYQFKSPEIRALPVWQPPKITA